MEIWLVYGIPAPVPICIACKQNVPGILAIFVDSISLGHTGTVGSTYVTPLNKTILGKMRCLEQGIGGDSISSVHVVTEKKIPV